MIENGSLQMFLEPMLQPGMKICYFLKFTNNIYTSLFCYVWFLENDERKIGGNKKVRK